MDQPSYLSPPIRRTPTLGSGGDDGGLSSEPSEELDLSGDYYQLGSATPIDLGTDGFGTMYWNRIGNMVRGTLFTFFDDDAVFPNTGFPIYIDKDALPYPPRIFAEGGTTGIFSFLGSTINKGLATGTTDFAGVGGLIWFLVVPAGPGLGGLLSDTNPGTLAGVETQMFSHVFYEGVIT